MLIVAAFALLTPSQSQAPDSLQRERVVGAVGAKLDSVLSLYAAHGFSGTVLVMRDRRPVLIKGYGFANIETRTPNTAATRFEMNSMTKMLTGVSILQLVAAGRLRLDAPVEQYLGDFPSAKRGSTVEQLAMHTAGLVVAGTDLASESREAFLTDVRRTPRETAPGASYRYTNAGYSLLAAIIERVTGDTYEAYIRKNAFAAAGMSTAMFRTQVPTTDQRFARGYVAGDRGPIPGPPNPYGWGTVGAGGVWCTVGDMYRWLVAVEDSVVIRGTQRALLFRPPAKPSLEAYGWHYTAASDSTPVRIDKGGGSDDFASQLLYFPTERLAVVWVSNDLSRRWRRTLNQAIPDLVLRGATSAREP